VPDPKVVDIFVMVPASAAVTVTVVPVTVDVSPAIPLIAASIFAANVAPEADPSALKSTPVMVVVGITEPDISELAAPRFVAKS
jgi:hypothetical protein